MNAQRPLDHMDRSSRNERLYQKLVGDGYCVEPIFDAGKYGGIQYLRVSVDLIRDQQDQG